MSGAFTVEASVGDDPRIRHLQSLLEQATNLQTTTTRLVAELTDQLQRSIFLHEPRDRGNPRRHIERRRKACQR